MAYRKTLFASALIICAQCLVAEKAVAKDTRATASELGAWDKIKSGVKKGADKAKDGVEMGADKVKEKLD